MYHHRVKESGNFHWHIVVSEVHHENEEALHTLHTNHYTLTRDNRNKSETVNVDGKELTLTTFHVSGVPLNFFFQASTTFNIQAPGKGRDPQVKPKRLNVVIFN
jgi:hypothetical protein